MDPIIKSIKSIISPNLIKCNKKSGYISFQEKQNQNTDNCTEVKIKRKKNDNPYSFAFQFHAEKSHSGFVHPLLNCHNIGLPLCPEGIVYIKNINYPILLGLIVEMKSNKASGWLNQVKVGKIISEYILSMLRFYQPEINIETVKYIGVCFKIFENPELEQEDPYESRIRLTKIDNADFYVTHLKCNIDRGNEYRIREFWDSFNSLENISNEKG